MTDATKFDFAGYVMPTAPFITRGRTTEKLYKLEEKTADAIRAGAKELATVLEIPEAMYWRQTLPEALMTILGSYDQEASIMAAVGFLRTQGIAVDTSGLRNFQVLP